MRVLRSIALICIACRLTNGLNFPMDEPQQNPPPTPAEQSAPKRRPYTPAENRNYYLLWTVGLLVWVLLCIRDGWFPEDPAYKHKAFNQLNTVIFGAALIYCFGQSLRYHLLARRQPPPSTPQPPSSNSP